MQAIRWLLYADYYTMLLFITKVLMNFKSGYKIQQLLITYTLAWEHFIIVYLTQAGWGRAMMSKCAKICLPRKQYQYINVYGVACITL